MCVYLCVCVCSCVSVCARILPARRDGAKNFRQDPEESGRETKRQEVTRLILGSEEGAALEHINRERDENTLTR